MADLAWAFLTIIAVNMWALANIIDRHIVSRRIKNSLVASITIGLFSLIYAALVYFFAGVNLSNPLISLFSFMMGVVSFMSIMIYYKAVQMEEISRVMPLYSTSTIFVLVMAVLFLNESFTLVKYLGILLLVAGAALISVRSLKNGFRISNATYLALAGSFVFAVFSVGTKYATNYMNFTSVYALESLGLFSASLIAFNLYRKQIIAAVSIKSLGIMFAVTILGSAASLTWLYAVSIGYISLINALDNMQPFFVLLYATLISIFRPGILKEEIKGSVILLKFVAIIGMLTGAYLITAL